MPAAEQAAIAMARPSETTAHSATARGVGGVDGAGTRAGEQALRDQFERLVREHTPRVLALIRRRSGRGVDAEDVAQDVFCKAWDAVRRGEHVRDFRAWVLTSAYRASVSASRRAAVRRAWVFRRPAACESSAPPEPSALWDLAHRVLTPTQVSALWLTIGEGLTARQVGVVLEKDERAVRMIVSRARRKLAHEAVARDLLS